MKLTALEIKQQTFDKSLRGYDPAEVQAFLNLVSNEWEHLVGKNKELNAQIDKLNEKLKHYEKVEAALHETLQTARESAEEKLGGARKESKSIIEKAELEAEAIIRQAHQQRQEIRQSVVRLIDRRSEMIAGIRSYLESTRESLQQFTRDESNLFSVPRIGDDEPAAAKPEGGDTKKKPSTPKRSGSAEPPREPGSRQMDDILDEID